VSPRRSRATRLARRLGAEPEELGPALWSLAYFFCLLASYYALRPVREEMGVAGGVERLPWLFTATFAAMLAATPAFGALAARYPRRTLLPVVYGFFIACVLALYAWLRSGVAAAWAPGVFFVWLSVFNLMVVSVFWSFMADIWREPQARRLFGVIAAGGSAGALAGPALTAVLAPRLGPVDLLPVAAALLAGALLCLARLRRWALARAATDSRRTRADDAEAPLGGGAFAGLALVARSPYLLGIALFVLLTTALATVVYFQQAHLVRAALGDPGRRTAVFALMDLAVNALTIGAQVLLTGRLVAWCDLSATLALLPALSLAGFAALAAAPALPVLVAFQVLRRATQYAVAGPAREMLFTVVTREEKYKAKNVIDTLVYRGGDAASGWAFAALAARGFDLAATALVALPLSAVWLVVALALGRSQAARRSGAR